MLPVNKLNKSTSFTNRNLDRDYFPIIRERLPQVFISDTRVKSSNKYLCYKTQIKSEKNERLNNYMKVRKQGRNYEKNNYCCLLYTHQDVLQHHSACIHLRKPMDSSVNKRVKRYYCNFKNLKRYSFNIQNLERYYCNFKNLK